MYDSTLSIDIENFGFLIAARCISFSNFQIAESSN